MKRRGYNLSVIGYRLTENVFDSLFDLLFVCLVFVAPFFLDFGQLILDHAHQLMFIGKQLVVVSDLLQEILIFVFDLLFFQALQSSQLHIEDRLRLDLGEAELLDEVVPRRRRRV